jgi:uncharacterized membrane protein SirB2
MIEILIIAGSIMLIIGFICLFKNVSNWLGFFLVVMGTYILSGGILMHQESHKPTAMDVYQGKTTLEYIIKDGVAVDSVVLFKNKEK